MHTRPVREIIQRDEPLTARKEDTVHEAAVQMAEHVCSSILICEDKKLLGIFTERDLLARVVAAGLDPKKTRLGDVMTPDPDTIEASESVVEAIRRFDEFSYRHLPVVEGERVLGVISLRDLPFDEMARMQPELDQRHALAERMW